MKVSGVYIYYTKTGKKLLNFTGYVIMDYQDGSYQVKTSENKIILVEKYCGDLLYEKEERIFT